MAMRINLNSDLSLRTHEINRAQFNKTQNSQAFDIGNFLNNHPSSTPYQRNTNHNKSMGVNNILIHENSNMQ
jgi:hypothetical protein